MTRGIKCRRLGLDKKRIKTSIKNSKKHPTEKPKEKKSKPSDKYKYTKYFVVHSNIKQESAKPVPSKTRKMSKESVELHRQHMQRRALRNVHSNKRPKLSRAVTLNRLLSPSTPLPIAACNLSFYFYQEALVDGDDGSSIL